MIRPVLGFPWFLGSIRASRQVICSCGLALALVVAGAGGAEEVPRSRAEIALSFAPVVRAVEQALA
jgi:hypothetical protein